MNDEEQSAVSLPVVLKQEAYMLFYAREVVPPAQALMQMPPVTAGNVRIY